MIPHFMCLITLVMILPLCEGNRTYEFKSLTATTSIQYFTSTGYPVSYQSNHTSEWLISTDYVNHTVKLQVVDCSVEYETKQKLCLYEKISFYDGNSTNGTALTPKDGYCCDPIPAIFNSTQSHILVQFYTDYNNAYKGFNISYFSDGPTTTTQTTTTTTTTTTSTTATHWTPSVVTLTTTTKSGTMTSVATFKTTNSSLEKTTASYTTSVVTMTPSYTTTTPSTTTTGSSSDENWKYILAGCVSGLVLLSVIVTSFVCCLCYKKGNIVNSLKQRPTSVTGVRPASFEAKQKEILEGADTPFAPGTGEKNGLSLEQTRNPVFEIVAPTGKANALPPIESRLV